MRIAGAELYSFLNWCQHFLDFLNPFDGRPLNYAELRLLPLVAMGRNAGFPAAVRKGKDGNEPRTKGRLKAYPERN